MKAIPRQVVRNAAATEPSRHDVPADRIEAAIGRTFSIFLDPGLEESSLGHAAHPVHLTQQDPDDDSLAGGRCPGMSLRIGRKRPGRNPHHGRLRITGREDREVQIGIPMDGDRSHRYDQDFDLACDG